MEFPKDFQDQALQLFKKYDKDLSHSIDIKELKSLMIEVAKEVNIPEPSDDELKIVFKDTDSNSDKKIQFHEFLELFKCIYSMKNPDK